METQVKEKQVNYRETLRDILKSMEGPLTYQDLENVLIWVGSKQRFILMTFGTDEGEEVMDKTVVASITSDEKIKIEKNNSDLNLAEELMRRGVLYEDIIK